MTSSKVMLAVLLLTSISQAALTQAQDQTSPSPPAGVHVKLALASDKTTFRIGEPIRLVMEFTSEADYQVDTLPDQKQPTSDAIAINPDSGISYWLDEMRGGFGYGRDVFASVKLSATPTRVALTLNDTLRFERPGRYTVKLTTRRVSSSSSHQSPGEINVPLVLTTNKVTFEVVSLSEAEEKKEVGRLSDLLDARHDLQTDENVTAELSYLTGDASTREKVRRFLNPENRTGNYSAHIMYGLYIARNRDLVLQLLETALRDSNQPVSFSLLRTVSGLRLLKERKGAPVAQVADRTMNSTGNPTGDTRLAEIENDYVRELAAGLSRRRGKSLTTTAQTILTSAKKDAENSAELTRESRRVLAQQFDSLHPFDQDYLLRMFWDDLRDPALIGSLKKMLSYNAIASKNIHDVALKRLIELAPDEARSYVIAEIREPASLVDLEILSSLSDKSLPEVDSSLLEQIRRLSTSRQNFDRVYLKQKVSLAVRYASENIYQEMMELYEETGPKLALEVRASFLAYFAKQNERDALPLIEQTLGDMKPSEDFNFLPELTKLYYSEGIATVLKKRLETDEPQVASNAAYLLGKHGLPGDELVLQAKLERWRTEWRDRVLEADANYQGMLERELIYALLHGKSWKLTPDRVKELQQSCVTKLCRESIR